MYLSVIKVEPIDDYKLILTFENNEQKIFDMERYLEIGIFKELRNKNIFKTVHISFDTIEWSNGADLDPEILYNESNIMAQSST